MASTPLVMRSASDIFDMSAFKKLSDLLLFFSGLRSDKRNLYFPASSRRRCVPTSPVAPVISTVFIP